MFEKLLLAGTITFALNIFIGMGAQSASQSTVVAQTAPQSVDVAQALHDSPFLRSLFQ
ncbi:MAG TPA: hypothetical protein V6D34_18450 [Candidatus Sericytochromatia bacterium]|jgi:hypothetical protein